MNKLKKKNMTTNKAQWKYYKESVVKTLRTIAKYVEEGKHDYHQQDLDRLLDDVKYNHAHYIELRDNKNQKSINKTKAIEL